MQVLPSLLKYWISYHRDVFKRVIRYQGDYKAQAFKCAEHFTAYLLAAIMKNELRLEQSLYTILQVLSLSLFEKMPILEAFSKKYVPVTNNTGRKQLTLFD